MSRLSKWLATVLCGFIYLAVPVVSAGTDEPPRLKIPPKLQVVRTAKQIAPVAKRIAPSVPSKSAPSWNVTGSMARAYNKTSLINHLLSHGNHSGKWSRSYLQSLTINQLWYLHDSDHNATRYRTAKPVNNWKPMKTWKKLCPT
jgi:hypothetical protein